MGADGSVSHARDLSPRERSSPRGLSASKRPSQGSVPGLDSESSALPTCPSGNVQAAQGELDKASSVACLLPRVAAVPRAEAYAALGRTRWSQPRSFLTV